MADQYDENAKDIAVLKVKQEYIEQAVLAISKDVSDIKRAFTTAGGVKLALMTIGGVIVFAITQLWHYVEYKGH